VPATPSAVLGAGVIARDAPNRPVGAKANSMTTSTDPEVIERARVAVAQYRRLSGTQKLATLDRADNEYLAAILHAPIGAVDGFSRGYAETRLLELRARPTIPTTGEV
jgi:hypothetical protein